ncbi:MAG: hypothetical protein A2Y38_24255 [Spirochaetes bacterium GWB1_59_5]|nr:MAG: hypothetical protein A2Y38_24255 [Spirochaetes bacterium GWB1_59_5]
MALRIRISVLIILLSSVPLALAQNLSVTAEYYGEIGCAHCDTFAAKDLPAAEQASGVTVELVLVDILSAEGYRQCEERLAGLGYSFRVFPVLVIGESVYQGNSAIEVNLVPELQYYAEHGAFRPRQEAVPVSASQAPAAAMRWAALPIFMAGLVDGINPCAFTTLLFFMSYLALRGGSKKRVAAAGLSFAAGVFLSYLLIGFGLFNAFRLGGRLRSLRLALRVVVSVITAAFCALTVRDIVMLRQGRQADLTLQLPDKLRLRIHASIRSGLGSRAFIAGVFGTGILVSVLELACTGQVYFPAISFMVQSYASVLGIGSLLLYNLAFITPLLAVLALALAGISQEAVRSYFQKRLVPAKAAQAAIFAVLAVLVWLY